MLATKISTSMVRVSAACILWFGRWVSSGTVAKVEHSEILKNYYTFPVLCTCGRFRPTKNQGNSKNLLIPIRRLFYWWLS